MDKDFETFLANARNIMRARICAYNNSSDVNFFTLGGSRMWLSYEDRQRLRLSIAAYEHDGKDEMTKVWKGTTYTFPMAKWKDMLAAVEIYASECQNVTERHLADVDALTSIDAVFAYDYKSGYPERLTFTMGDEQTGATEQTGTADEQTKPKEDAEPKEGTETEQPQP